MLQYADFNAIESLSDRLAGNSLHARPKPGTPLAALNDALREAELKLLGGLNGERDTNPGRYEYREANIAVSKEPSADGIYTHDLLQEKHGAALAEIISAMLNQAQNEAVPLIGEVIKQAQAMIGERVENQVKPVDILRAKYPSFLTSPAVDAMTSHYAEIQPSEVSLPKELNAVENPVELLKQGSVFTDADIDAFVEEVGVDFVNQVFDAYFVRTGEWKYGDAELNVISGNCAIILLTFLFTCTLSKESQPLLGADDESACRRKILEAKAELGRRICRIISNRSANIAINKLIVSYPNGKITDMYIDDNFIVVNDDTYDKWLEKGGDADILLGAYVTDRETNPDTLIEKGELYRSRWTEVNAFLTEQTRSALLSTTKSSVVDVIRRLIAESEEGKFAAAKSVLQRKLIEVTESTANAMFGDLDRVAMRLVCRVFFPHLYTEKILTEIDHQSKTNPTLAPRQLATIAATVVWADWAFDTMVEISE